MRPKLTADDKAYLAWIRTLDCSICDASATYWNRIEAAHTNALGSSGMGQKTGPKSAIPLHGISCHREGKLSYHKLGERKFVTVHSLDLPALVARLNRCWVLLKAQ